MMDQFHMQNSSVSPLKKLQTSTMLPSPVQPMPKQPDQGSSTMGYILVPVVALLMVVIVSALVLMLLRKRRINRFRQHLMPLYNFDATDENPEEWEAELLDDISESRSLRRGYKSMEFPSPQSGARFS